MNGPHRSIDSRLCTGCRQWKLMFDQWLHTCLRPTPLVFAATCNGGRCFSLEHYIVHLLMCTHEQAHYCNLHCVVVVLYTILYYFTLHYHSILQLVVYRKAPNVLISHLACMSLRRRGRGLTPFGGMLTEFSKALDSRHPPVGQGRYQMRR